MELKSMTISVLLGLNCLQTTQRGGIEAQLRCEVETFGEMKDALLCVSVHIQASRWRAKRREGKTLTTIKPKKSIKWRFLLQLIEK